MLFDESARQKLLKKYQAMPEEERTLYRVLSVVFIPVTASVLAPVFTAAMSASGFKSKWNVSQCKELMERWQQAKLVERCNENYSQGWACSTLMTEPAVRESIDRGEFAAFEAAADNVLKFSAEERMNRYSSLTRYIRALRKAIYLGSAKGCERLEAASVSAGYSRYGSAAGINPFLLILANPLDLKSMCSLTPRFGGAAFDSALMETLDSPALFNEIFAAFETYCKEHIKIPDITAGWSRFAVLQGKADEAQLLLAKANYAEQYSTAALSALMKGERARAAELYEEGLAAMRKVTKKRKVAYSSWAGIFYPVLLLASGEPVKKIEGYLDGAEGGFGGRMSLFPSKMTRFLLPGKAKHLDFSRAGTAVLDKPQRCLDAFFFLLCAYWLDANKARQLLPLAENTYKTLTALGFSLPASELAAMILEFWPETNGLLPPPPCPLKDILARQSDWERSLNALSGIGGKTATVKGAKRFVWEIAWRPAAQRSGDIDLIPIEQSLQTNGWSKGKNVALRRLYRKADSLPSMTDQDHRAASAVREERSYYGIDYYIDTPQALEALVGHPFVFRAEDGGRMEIVADEPQLTAVENGDAYRLKLSPFPEGDSAPQRIVREDGPNCLRVTRFEERHVKIAEILGEQGLLIPSRAKEALLKALGSLASVVTIHSDLDGIESNARQTEADSRIYVQLQPSDDGDGGAYGLDACMVVRPLGPNGVPCRPGVGGGSIFGLADGVRVQARRDLDGEKDALATAVRACPALMDGEQTAGERWRLPTPELSLELLMQVQEMGGSVVAEWPKGQAMRVRSQVSMSSMNVTARGAQDWFALSGSLTVDEDLVLSMKDLMELLKAGHGRFLPIGDGQFLALTNEFRRRLDALAALSDMKGGELRVPPLAVGMLEPLFDEAGSFEGGKEWQRRAALVTEAADMTPELPSTFKGDLRNYQLEGYRWLTRLAHWGAGACLADDMGLGKTIQALAVLVARGSGGAALVVAPTSVCSNWVAEADRFAPTLNVKELRYGDREKILGGLNPFDVVVTTYGLLQNEIERMSAIRWHTIVLDEAQAIKNMGTKRSAAAMKLAADFRMATTGTPIENHLSELWNLFRFLNPHFLGSFDSFNRRFAVPIERDGDAEARARLKKVIQPFILRRNKQQVLEELPSKTEITLRVDLKEEEQAFYEALRRDSVEKLSLNDAADQRFRIFAELMRLRRACCNAVLAMPEESRENDKNFPSAKLEAFAEILADLRESGHKALVFSQFVDHLAIIRRYLDGEKVPYQYLDGSTPPQERTRRVAAFQAGEGDCFLISLKAGGTGLNLTAADYVIHMDPWWNPAVEEQASDRAHRIGQSRPVTVYRIVAKGTIEEKIVDLHAWKRDLAESLLDESETPLRLSAEEMLDLIRSTGA